MNVPESYEAPKVGISADGGLSALRSLVSNASRGSEGSLGNYAHDSSFRSLTGVDSSLSWNNGKTAANENARHQLTSLDAEQSALIEKYRGVQKSGDPSRMVDSIRNSLKEIEKRRHSLEVEMAKEKIKETVYPQMRVECDACESLTRRVIELESKHKAQVAEYETKLTQCHSELSKVVEALKGLKAKENEHKNVISSCVSSVKGELASLSSSKSEVVNALDKWKGQWEEQVKGFTADIGAMKSASTAAELEAAKLHSDQTELTSRYKVVGDIATKMVKEIDSCKNQMASVKAQQAQVKSTLESIQAAMGKYESLSSSVADKAASAASKVNSNSEWASKLQETMADFNRLKEDVKKQERVTDNYQAIIDEHRRSIDRMWDEQRANQEVVQNLSKISQSSSNVSGNSLLK